MAGETVEASLVFENGVTTGDQHQVVFFESPHGSNPKNNNNNKGAKRRTARRNLFPDIVPPATTPKELDSPRTEETIDISSNTPPVSARKPRDANTGWKSLSSFFSRDNTADVVIGLDNINASNSKSQKKRMRKEKQQQHPGLFSVFRNTLQRFRSSLWKDANEEPDEAAVMSSPSSMAPSTMQFTERTEQIKKAAELATKTPYKRSPLGHQMSTPVMDGNTYVYSTGTRLNVSNESDDSVLDSNRGNNSYTIVSDWEPVFHNPDAFEETISDGIVTDGVFAPLSAYLDPEFEVTSKSSKSNILNSINNNNNNNNHNYDSKIQQQQPSISFMSPHDQNLPGVVVPTHSDHHNGMDNDFDDVYPVSPIDTSPQLPNNIRIVDVNKQPPPAPETRRSRAWKWFKGIFGVNESSSKEQEAARMEEETKTTVLFF